MGAHDTFVANKDLIEQVTGAVCQRNHIYGDDRDDFTQDLWLHVIKDDYAVIRKHEGRSSLRTYLTTVAINFLRDCREKKWGKWRCSSRAKRLGKVAEQLETLIVRDGLTMDHACEMLRARDVVLSRAELDAMAAQFPVRTRLRFVDMGEDPPEPQSLLRTDAAVDAEAARSEARRVRRAVGEVLGALAPADRLILKLRFHDGLPLVDIAKLVQIEQKLFYRRFDELLKGLRAALETSGLTPTQVLDLLECRGLAALEDVDD